MTERMDVLTGREKDGKTYWTRIGVAFESKDGAGWNIYLDALPVSGQAIMRPPKPREDRQSGGQAPQGGGELDDTIPFAPEVR